jgi:hypothetical protein
MALIQSHPLGVICMVRAASFTVAGTFAKQTTRLAVDQRKAVGLVARKSTVFIHSVHAVWRYKQSGRSL